MARSGCRASSIFIGAMPCGFLIFPMRRNMWPKPVAWSMVKRRLSSKAWFEPLCHRLKHQPPEDVLAEVRHLLKQCRVQAASPERVATVQTSLQYLETRRAMMAYADFQHQGYPIGDGSVESANKLVVESRLKQAGMRWAEVHVNPLVALRNVVCNDRWSEAWPQVMAQLRRHAQHRTAARRALRVHAEATTSPTVPSVPLAVPPKRSTPVPEPSPKSKAPYRPAPDHPWRRSPIGRARASCRPLTQNPDAHSAGVIKK